MILGDREMSSTETDAEIIKKMGINMAVIAVVLLSLVYVSFALDPF